jgi:polyprenyl-phospho-N-acetylgalactosaminyl synthase
VQNPSVFVVVPAYNEATVVRGVIGELLDRHHNVVVVDDCSTDGTAAALGGLACHVLRHPVNLGQGGALQTGVHYAVAQGADIIVTFDSDGQHNPDEIPALVKAIVDGGVDVALGSRFLGQTENMSTSRRLLLRGAILFTKVTVGITLTDVHNGFRAFRASVAPKLIITQNRMAHASEILSLIQQNQLSFREVPSTVRYSEYSKAKGQSALGAVDIVTDLFQRQFRL